MTKVLITDALDAAAVEVLRNAGHDVVIDECDAVRLLQIVGGAEALLVRSRTKVTKEVIAAAQRLKVIGRAGVGLDNIDVEAAKAAGIRVVNAPESLTNAVAELTLGQMLNLSRSLARADASMRAGKWEKKELLGGELAGKTLGLLGIGRIGGRVADLARAFGMRIVAYDPYLNAQQVQAHGATKLETVDAVLERADFVSIHVPLTPETKGLLNAPRFARMKETAFVLNLARGGIIDEKALVDALDKGHIAGAALDVFEKEPPEASPLTRHPRIVLTPHVGGNTAEAQEKAGTMVAGQVVEILSGKPATTRTRISGG